MRAIIIIFLVVLISSLTVRADAANGFQLISTVFENNDSIPAKYTCNAENVSPPLAFRDVPAQAQSLVLTVSDPDAPSGTWVHWIVYNIAPNTQEIAENTNPGIEGVNNFGKYAYGGPCPPDEKTHHYIFHAYALDTLLDISEGASLDEIKKAMQGHIIAQTQLVGTYHKPS